MTCFRDFLLNNRKEKNIRIFFDIETLQYNTDAGEIKPSNYKNVTYSFAIGFYVDDKLEIKVYPSFKNFINEVVGTYNKWKITPKIELIAHNNNKYDNHFLRHDLIYFYNLKIENLFLKNATKEGNILTTKKTEVDKTKKQGLILEKRIKSSNNLELNFFLNGVEFYTTDNYMKTNTSIAVLGKKLLNFGLISEDDLKTDFEYTKFNKEYDMSNEEAYKYAEKVFSSLNESEMTYIRNDIIILAESVRNYSLIFQGFDYSKITFTSNILEYYNDNDLTSYQLLKSVGKGNDKDHLKYTNYKFDKENFYDYLKSFYAGGLNFYNDRLVGQIQYDPTIAMDINSSYPYVMHNYKVPTFIKDFREFGKETTIEIERSEDFYLYRMTKSNFDFDIVDKIKSKIIKQMIVKYYTKNDYVNINSKTIELLEDICHIKIEKIRVLSWVSFECEYFGSRDKIADKYYTKEQGSTDKKIDYKNPYDIKITEEENTETFSQGEIDIAKVILNGLYGIPALRSHFNVFRWIGDELKNVPNGYENNERNIVFSVFVTSVALYNLLEPFKHLTHEEIDEYFIYCDTDSLYFNKKVEHKIPSEMFHVKHLGKWSMDDNNILKFLVINHKKYAYETMNKGKKVIEIKAGGIPNNSFKTEGKTFEEFVSKQFTNNVDIKNLKSIFNNQGTISIYDSTTTLKVGKGYRLYAYDELHEQMKQQMIQEIRDSGDGSTNDLLYIESNLGTFSEQDVFPHEYESNEKQSLRFLKMFEEDIRYKYFP